MTTKIAVSLPTISWPRRGRRWPRGGRASVSAYVADALTEKSGRRSLGKVLAAWRSESGPATPEEDAWVEGALGIPDELSQ